MLQCKAELVPFLISSGFTEKEAQRFIAKVDDSGGPDACWEWMAWLTSTGYGGVRLKGKAQRVNRLVCFAVHTDQEGPCALHSCDNRKCCNPNHLRCGTKQDNMHDMVMRGRHNKQKLSPSDVRAIRVWRKLGYTLEEIASVFGVHFSTIGYIITGKNWSHLDASPSL